MLFLSVCGQSRSHLNLKTVTKPKIKAKTKLFSWHISWLTLFDINPKSSLCMDKKIAKKRFTVKKVLTYVGTAAVVLFVAYQFIFADRRSKLKTEKDKITISEVKMGLFKEYIPQTGTVEPSRTVYLDAIEGGNIKKIYRESGSMLK